MSDLFGMQVTAPTIKPAKALFNAAAGFAEFWAAYPPGSRKVAKQQCLNRWAKLHCADHAAHIVAYVGWMKTQADWLKDSGAFICGPLPFLAKQGWIDWAPEPERPKKPSELDRLNAERAAWKPPSEEVKAALKRARQRVTV